MLFPSFEMLEANPPEVEYKPVLINSDKVPFTSNFGPVGCDVEEVLTSIIGPVDGAYAAF